MADEVSELALHSSEPVAEDICDFPAVRYDVPPYRTFHFFQEFRTNQSNPNNFLKGVKWSPDGSCFLTCNEDNTLRVFSLPYGDTGGLDAPISMPDSDSYGPNVVMSEGESAYDYCWYPHMSTSNPDLSVFATSTHDHPIHLWDANSGQLRCTYRAYDAMDEITAAFSIGFNHSGNKIFAGYNKAIRIFDVHRPGRDFEQHSTVLGNKEGQSGIISSIAFSPTCSGMLAAGSYNQTTAIYREDNMELLYVLHGQEGGVTLVQFSKDGKLETTCILGEERILIFYAGIYAKLLILSTSYIDHPKAPTKEYSLILSLLVDILEQAVRMVWYIFTIFRLGLGYRAFKAH